MKVMFRRQDDNALFCLVASEAGYDPRLKQLWFQGFGSSNFTEAVIHDMDAVEAENILWKFFRMSSLNLTDHKAEIIPGTCEV